jgi:O-glycosyl hydrolase
MHTSVLGVLEAQIVRWRLLVLHFAVIFPLSLVGCALLISADGSDSGPAVTVTWSEPYQKIEGFGAAAAFQCGSAGYTAPCNSWTQAETDLLFCSVTTPVQPPCQRSGIGLSLLRIQIDPDGNYPFVNNAQAAIARGARVWGTPWTAPAAYKSNDSETNGGTLLPLYYQNWATYLSNYVSTLNNSYGIPLYALSVQNEPDLSEDYQSMNYTGSQLASFIASYLGPALAADNPTVKIMIPEESTWQMDLAVATDVDPIASSYVNIIAAHGYQVTTPSSLTVNTGQEVWETEDSDLSNPDDPSLINALGWAATINYYFTHANINAWLWWWAVDSVDCSGEGLINDSNNGSPCSGTVVAKRFWVTGQWSAFVRPGWVRMDATVSPLFGVSISAFKEPVSGNFAIVVVNLNSSPQTLTFDLNGFSAVSSVTSWVTDSADNLARQSAVAVSGNTFSTTVPGASVTTLVNF